MKLFLISAAAASLMFAADSATVWSATDINGKLEASKGDASKIRQDSLGQFPGYSMSVTKREASGAAELHKAKNDVFVVLSGECSLITGGAITSPKNQSTTEVRGSAVEGGQKHTLHTGDVVHIPANVPHQMLLDPGKFIVYAVVKTDTR